MTDRVAKASIWADGGLGLYQLESGEVLTRDELAVAVMEGTVSGIAIREDHGGLTLLTNNGEDDDVLELLSPISEDDLQAWYKHNGRLPTWSYVPNRFTE